MVCAFRFTVSPVEHRPRLVAVPVQVTGRSR